MTKMSIVIVEKYMYHLYDHHSQNLQLLSERPKYDCL